MPNQQYNNILIILTSPKTESDQRLDFIFDLTKKIANEMNSKNVNVNAIDLCNETEFDSGAYLKPTDSKVIEYQIKINKADLIMIFTPIINDTIPANLKGFIDNTLVQGFAINYENKLTVGKMQDKDLLVFAFDNRPMWQTKFIFGDQVNNFFNKTIKLTFGFGKVNVNSFENFRSISKEQLTNVESKVVKICEKLNISKKV